MKDLKELAISCHQEAMSHGFWDNQAIEDPNVLAAKLCLIHSEVSEALEAARKKLYDCEKINGKPEGVITELADVVIRVFDLAEAMFHEDLVNTDIETAIVDKMHYNAKREYKHGKVI